MISKEVAAKALTAAGCAELVKTASAYKSEIFLCAENKKVNAKSLMGVIALGLKTPKKIIVKAEGEDETAAVTALTSFLTK